MLGRCDILVCLVPLTSETRGLVNAARLADLKLGAALINFARGPIVVTGDLIAVIDAGHLRHAVLDVFEVEPLPVESALWSHAGVTVLPHISGPIDMSSAAARVAANLRTYRRTGQPPRGVDPAQGYQRWARPRAGLPPKFVQTLEDRVQPPSKSRIAKAISVATCTTGRLEPLQLFGS